MIRLLPPGSATASGRFMLEPGAPKHPRFRLGTPSVAWDNFLENVSRHLVR